MCSFWPASDHHCLPPMLPAQDEGWGRPTRSAHPSNEVHKPDKLWFRMKSLGEKLKEANEHEKSLQPRHRWAALPTPAAANLLATVCFPPNPSPTNNQQLPVAKKPGFLLRNGNIHSQFPVRPIFAISHALKSLWDGVLVSWQGFCATRLNIFKCLHNRAPEASLFGSSYCQGFPKYEADHINTNCSHPPDRSAGGKEKKEKEKSVQHLLQVLQSLWAVKQHKPAQSSCMECAGIARTGTAQRQHKMGRKPRQTRARKKHFQMYCTDRSHLYQYFFRSLTTNTQMVGNIIEPI